MNEDQLIAKQINFCSKQSCKLSLNLINDVIDWLWNNWIWIVLSNNDGLFGYLMNVLWVHTIGRSCVMTCRSQNSWEGFPLSWKWVSGETPLDILEMSHLHYMFGMKHEWDGIYYVDKTWVDMKWKEELVWQTEGLST